MKRELDLFPYEDSISQEINICGIEPLYNMVFDSLSRTIFLSRLLYSLTMDENCLLLAKQSNEEIRKINNENLYIYGAGIRGRRVLDILSNRRVKGVIDKYKTGYIGEYRIESLENKIFSKDDYVLVSVFEYRDIIVNDLCQHGALKEKICFWDEIEKRVREKVYFESRCLPDKEKIRGAFIDAGGFDGKSTLMAMRELPACESFLVFEPDKTNYDKCVDCLSGYDNVQIYNKGLYDKCDEKYFVEEGLASRVSDSGKSRVTLVTIDEIISNDLEVGYIKMDIEGSEEQAIIGAERTIRKWKPILAVSVYHKRYDIIRLPMAIMRLNPEYRFFFGHYSPTWDDTVLYAVDEKYLK